VRAVLNLGEIVAAHARLTPQKIGTRDSRRTLTYAQWNSRACKLANALLALDRAKSWETVYEAVKAANAAESFTGEDGAIRTILQTKNSSSVRSSSSGEFNVAGIFGELAKEDYNKTVEVIRGFQREAPRASATIAIARAVLDDKKN